MLLQFAFILDFEVSSQQYLLVNNIFRMAISSLKSTDYYFKAMRSRMVRNITISLAIIIIGLSYVRNAELGENRKTASRQLNTVEAYLATRPFNAKPTDQEKSQKADKIEEESSKGRNLYYGPFQYGANSYQSGSSFSNHYSTPSKYGEISSSYGNQVSDNNYRSSIERIREQWAQNLGSYSRDNGFENIKSPHKYFVGAEKLPFSYFSDFLEDDSDDQFVFFAKKFRCKGKKPNALGAVFVKKKDAVKKSKKINPNREKKVLAVELDQVTTGESNESIKPTSKGEVSGPANVAQPSTDLQTQTPKSDREVQIAPEAPGTAGNSNLEASSPSTEPATSATVPGQNAAPASSSSTLSKELEPEVNSTITSDNSGAMMPETLSEGKNTLSDDSSAQTSKSEISEPTNVVQPSTDLQTKTPSSESQIETAPAISETAGGSDLETSALTTIAAAQVPPPFLSKEPEVAPTMTSGNRDEINLEKAPEKQEGFGILSDLTKQSSINEISEPVNVPSSMNSPTPVPSFILPMQIAPTTFGEADNSGLETLSSSPVAAAPLSSTLSKESEPEINSARTSLNSGKIIPEAFSEAQKALGITDDPFPRHDLGGLARFIVEPQTPDEIKVETSSQD